MSCSSLDRSTCNVMLTYIISFYICKTNFVCKLIANHRYAISDVSMICGDTYKVFICISVQIENLFLSKMYAEKLSFRLFPLVFPVQCAVFAHEKPLAKLLLLLLLLDDVYMPIMATSKVKEIPVAKRPFLTSS